ncbi:MAG: ATP-binding cassette domain-containing protein [Paludibacteraceae bacterium]|nr:ATP-binding cassette domain-containing protein [Paludibacteraceae bacterium]MBR5822764.1 ATP-binding cassette domain-containing protein [Paludibacteraceae bacterium]
MIQFNNTYFIYDEKPLISGFSVNIARGEKVVIYGPSGSGKSTLIHAILGFVQAEQGEIIVNNLPISPDSINEIRQLTSWLPQDISLPYNSVRDMILAPFEFKANHSRKPSDQEILAEFDKLKLEHNLLEKGITEISGGQKQRILLLTTVLLRKPILLLDEPTSALDAQSVDLVINYLKSLTDITIIAISHDEKFINAFDRKLLIGQF